jgi:hypothetical protein
MAAIDRLKGFLVTIIVRWMDQDGQGKSAETLDSPNISGYVGNCVFHVDDGLEGQWVYSRRATMSKFRLKEARAKPRAGSAFGLVNSPSRGPPSGTPPRQSTMNKLVIHSTT